jgi:hypothetical protein
MNKLFRSFVVALSIPLAGCFIQGGGPLPGDPLDSAFYATWATVDALGFIGSCYAVADVVRITSFNDDTGDMFVDNFDCGYREGTTGGITAGHYTVDVELIDCGGWYCADGGFSIAGFTVDGGAVFENRVVYDLGDFVFDVL